MYTVDNTTIGKHLKKLVLKKYNSARKFAKQWLIVNKEVITEESINNRNNKLSQIFNGNKGIQITDIPVFTSLLHISCDELLSGGQCNTAALTHLSNYNVALSNDKRVWEEYMQYDPKLILNADEYGQTIVDYAVDFGNYNLLKFLMDNNYIYFIGNKKEDYMYGFGAGTTVKSYWHEKHNIEALYSHMHEKELRIKLLTLAIKAQDIETLEKLHAREIETFYLMSAYSTITPECQKYYNEEFVDAISNSSDKILDYFTQSFDFCENNGNVKEKLMFPFINELIQKLIKKNNTFTEYVLKNVVEHNQYVYNKLSEMIEKTIKDYHNKYSYLSESDIYNAIKKEIRFYSDGNIVNYRNIVPDYYDAMMTNFVKIDEESNEPRIKHLIKEVNLLHDKIANIKDNF